MRASLEQSLPPDLQDTLDEALNRASTLAVEGVGHVLQRTSEWLSHIVELVIIPILTFYFLVDLPDLQQELVAFLPPTARQPVLTSARRLDRIVAGYVRGQITLMILAWLVVWIGLALLGMRYALLLGIVAGITRGIPIIGPVLGAIPIVGLALIQSPTVGVTVLVFFVALQVIESKVVLPLVMGHQLDLNGATILIALLAGNALFGLIGVFLASPVAAFLKEIVTLADRGFTEPDTAASEAPSNA
jgi:predicted PurR-regulated permease PerM